MKKIFITILMLFAARFAFADSVLIESFEYGNHDLQIPVGWVCDDSSWLAGYLPKDHNRIAHHGNWYAFTTAEDSWMFMDSYLSTELKYRFYFWAVSDGLYDIEIWAGDGPSADHMTYLLMSRQVNSDTYCRFSEYIETLPSSYQYFGIRAVAHEGAYHLTIDDIEVEMVARYALETSPYSIDTTLMPGERIIYNFKVQNTGYEPLEITMNDHSQYFYDFDYYADGVNTRTFHTEPNQVVMAQCHATLSPEVEIGSVCFFDIVLTVSCDCVTSMTTVWATVGTNSIEENVIKIGVYPNPANGVVTVEGNGLMTVTNALGQKVLSKEIVDKETITLQSGLYFITINGVTRTVNVR